jgi:hypothetical protein
VSMRLDKDGILRVAAADVATAWRRAPRSCTRTARSAPTPQTQRSEPLRSNSERVMPSPGCAGPTDWYSILGVAPDAATEQIAVAVERLTRQANALSITAPERARQLRDQVRAIKRDLLSGAESRQRYDHRLVARAAADADSPPPVPAPTASPHPAFPGPPTAPYRYNPPSPAKAAPDLMSRISKFLQTGWTCVSCGYGAQPTDKFCPRCGNRVESGLSGQARGGSPNPVPEAQAVRCDKCGSCTTSGATACRRPDGHTLSRRRRRSGWSASPQAPDVASGARGPLGRSRGRRCRGLRTPWSPWHAPPHRRQDADSR